MKVLLLLCLALIGCSANLPNVANCYGELSLLTNEEFNITSGVSIARDVQGYETYIFTFDVKFHNYTNSYDSLVYLGADKWGPNARTPAIFTTPDLSSMKLHIRQSTAKNPNEGCNPSTPVQLGVWTTVKVRVTPNNVMDVYYDGIKVCETQLVDPIVTSSDNTLWLSHERWIPADATVRNIKYIHF
mmetsp:Transcript_11334/g.16941  ORF Transcript_11334/g.16941 Transcript_11334/m.16941 type:complete len:187 (+) Transcript_11334:63-623(+)